VPGREREGLYVRLAGKLRELFPDSDEVEWEFRWTGFIAQTPDSYPRLLELAPGVIACLGYSGRGIAMSTLMGAQMAKWVNHESAINDLALPVSSFRELPYYALKDLLIEGAVRFYAFKDRVGGRR
jgi:glycine/D-amino acid oxidase-like deaminating enzyme